LLHCWIADCGIPARLCQAGGVIGRSNPQDVAAQRCVDLGAVAKRCESLRIVANRCESLRIVANRCVSLRFLANLPTGRQAGLCVQDHATQGGMLLVPAYLPEVGRQKHGTNPGRQVVAFLCVLLPIADLLNCVIAEFLPAGPAAGGQAGRRYRPSGSDSNSGTSAM